MPDWKYSYKHRQWELTVGDWRAVVVRASLHDAWHTSIEHTSRAERHTGPDFEWPRDGRAWCEAEIARLAARTSSA